MSEKVNKALIDMLNELSDIETNLSKVEAAVFIKKSDNLMKEKISYLYNLLQAEVESYGQSSKEQLDYIEKIIMIYKDKLNIIYNELYLQYVNVQNEIGEARINQKAGMINYQRIINDMENGKNKSSKMKKQIKDKNAVYEEIIQKCENQISVCTNTFEEEVNKNFLIEANLKVINESNIFQKIKNKILNLISGNKKCTEALAGYEADVSKIDAEKIAKKLREQTIDFIAEILEIKDVELEEAV